MSSNFGPFYHTNRSDGGVQYDHYDLTPTDEQKAALSAAWPDVPTTIIQRGAEPGFALRIGKLVSRQEIEAVYREVFGA